MTTFRKLRTRLTRAVNSGDPQKVIDECKFAIACWHGWIDTHPWDRPYAWPDSWHSWNNAYGDALTALYGWQVGLGADLNDLLGETREQYFKEGIHA